jgi:dinuclear metal center YbgI/SA1388 family protein
MSNMTVAEIVGIIAEVAPPATAAAWDNVGLQVGDAEAVVDTVLVTLDMTAAVVDEAIEVGAQLIVSHHPLIFDPLTSVLADDIAGGLVIRLLGAGVSLYAAHTNLDAAAEVGTAAALARLLDVRDTRPLLAEDGVGLGALGELADGLSLERFVALVHERLRPSRLTVVGECAGPIRTVALMPGSGGDAVRPAAAAGADVLVCGDLKHHDALDALALGLMVVDAGHYATELPVVGGIVRLLEERCGGAANIVTSRVVTDPFAAIRGHDSAG